MAKPSHKLLLFLLISSLFTAELSAVAAAAAAATAPSSAVNFIKASCRATTYPAVCVRSLSLYANAIQRNPRRLAETALNVSLSRAQSTKLFVARLARFKGLQKREYQAIKDCVEEIGDTIDRLTKSVQELRLCGMARGDQFWFHMSNVQTWASAALTDENTCSDGFSGRILDGKIKSSVRARIVNVGQETSNALALINSFAKRQ